MSKPSGLDGDDNDREMIAYSSFLLQVHPCRTVMKANRWNLVQASENAELSIFLCNVAQIWLAKQN